MLKKLLDKYLLRNKKSLENTSQVFQQKTPYSAKLADTAHDFITILVEETKKYCKEKGYDIDRISFFSVYDADLNLEEAHASNSSQIQLNSDIILKIIKKDDEKYEAVIFSGSYVETNILN